MTVVARSPIYAHFTETLGGLSAIRAFGHVNLFARTNERLVDNNLASHFALKVSSRSRQGGLCFLFLSFFSHGVAPQQRLPHMCLSN